MLHWRAMDVYHPKTATRHSPHPCGKRFPSLLWWRAVGLGSITAVLQSVPRIVLGDDTTRLVNPLANTAGDRLDTFLKFVFQVVIVLAFPAIVLFIVYAGFRYLVASAQGQPDKVKEINKTLLWAIVGALLILGSWALVDAIGATVCTIAPRAFGCSP